MTGARILVREFRMSKYYGEEVTQVINDGANDLEADGEKEIIHISFEKFMIDGKKYIAVSYVYKPVIKPGMVRGRG